VNDDGGFGDSTEIIEADGVNGNGSIDDMIAALEHYRNDLKLIGELIVCDNQVLAERRLLTWEIVKQLKTIMVNAKLTANVKEKNDSALHPCRFFSNATLNGYDVVYFFDYHRKCESENDNREECVMSKKIRAPKSLDMDAIAFFTELLSESLGGGFSVCVVPSHSRRKRRSGIKEVAINVAKKADIADATDCLECFRSIRKQAISHRKRNMEIHLDSIRVRNGLDIRGKDFLLLDDVGTSGWSIAACRRILAEAGSAVVKCAVLGRTVNNTGGNVTDEMRHAVMVH
jgi:hypothetical protein